MRQRRVGILEEHPQTPRALYAASVAHLLLSLSPCVITLQTARFVPDLASHTRKQSPHAHTACMCHVLLQRLVLTKGERRGRR